MDPDEISKNDQVVLPIIEEVQTDIDDLEALLNGGKLSTTFSVNGATASENTNISSNTDPALDAQPSVDPISDEKMEAEKALKNLEESAFEHQRSIEELRKINNSKDKTIASLSSINDELLAEIRRLKSLSQNDLSLLSGDLSKSSNNVIDLRSEIKSLKNSLILKSNQIKDLRMRNDSLEVRISSLEQTPASKVFLARPTLDSNKPRPTLPTPQPQDQVASCSLRFDAVVTSYSGKSKEAFYNEFFVVRKSLVEALSEGGVVLSDYPGIGSFSELWAKARKNSFLFPELHEKIRDLLLDQVNAGNGSRIRTDINGSAFVDNLKSGRYFIIGCASLGKVGVTWNVPVTLQYGLNKVSLTLANASWSM